MVDYMTGNRKLVEGVGVNDSDYVTEKYDNSGPKKKLIFRCPFYQAWRNMLMRCYSDKYQKRQPTYVDCSVCDEWLTFSNFKRWMERQDWQGKHLDKDLLIAGNKIYGPDRCCFISKRLNNFIAYLKKRRGNLPQGVTICVQTKKFQVRCGSGNHLGRYANIDDASEAWRVKKIEFASAFAAEQTDARVAEALLKMTFKSSDQ